MYKLQGLGGRGGLGGLGRGGGVFFFFNLKPH
jgi:hypothetical protein